MNLPFFCDPFYLLLVFLISLLVSVTCALLLRHFILLSCRKHCKWIEGYQAGRSDAIAHVLKILESYGAAPAQDNLSCGSAIDQTAGVQNDHRPGQLNS